MSFTSDALEKARRMRIVEKSAGETQPSAERVSPDVVFTEVETIEPTLSRCLREIVRPDGLWAEQFRALREKLRSLGGSDRIRRLGIVSASGGEGKTTIAVALSIILAEEPTNKVLLLDADLRHRDVHRYLGIASRSGLADWLENPRQVVETVRLANYGTHVLGAGRLSKHPWELITSAHLGTLLEAARRAFDYVVIDCPPRGPVSDTARIQEYLDGILFVVRSRTAPRETVLNAVEQLDEEKILGVVLNDFRRSVTNYYHYVYSHYKTR